MSGKLTPEQAQFVSTLEGFSRTILKYDEGTFYPWMEEAMASIERPGSRTSIRTCNGAGKTSRIFKAVALWAMSVFPKCKVVYTTASARQLRYQMWPALEGEAHRFDGWEFRESNFSIKSPRGAQFVGFATDKAGRAEGWHGNKDPFYDLDRHDGPLIFLVDEAKTVPDAIFEAIDRCTVQRYVEASSPGFAEGAFYRHHTSEAKFFKTLRVSADDCPHVDGEANQRLIEQYGADHPLVRSKVFADFMAESEDAVIPLAVLDAAYENAPSFMPGERRAHFDFAAGGDENVFALREGNKVTIEKAWRETDTMKACGEFIRMMRHLRLSAHECSGDDDGLGGPMIDRFHEMGWPIRRINAQSRANRPEDFYNWSAESWFDGRAAMEKHAFILPIDEQLRMQLTSRKVKGSSTGKLQLESKADMRKRGIASPDRADAVLEVMREMPRSHSIPMQGESKWDRWATSEEREIDEGVLAGMDAGL